jgi:hypothetical protein
MARKTKFTEKQKGIVCKMYVLEKYPISKIKKRCNFPISKETIYNILKNKNIPLIRKTGTKHNLIGKTFGYLTVIKMEQTNKSGKLHEWRAICQCSNCSNKNFDTHPQALLRGSTTSCGCRRDQYLKITGKNSVQYTGYEELNGKYWGVIKNRANKRGYSINISIEYAWNLYIQQNRKCALSGLPINFAISNKKSSETSASLDRIDSTKGYVEDNIQWVHKHVNIMKNVYNQNYFIYLCELITKNKTMEILKDT